MRSLKVPKSYIISPNSEGGGNGGTEGEGSESRRGSYSHSFNNHNNSDGVKHIPVKIYLPISNLVLQSPVEPYYEEGSGGGGGVSLGLEASGVDSGLGLSNSIMKNKRMSASSIMDNVLKNSHNNDTNISANANANANVKSNTKSNSNTIGDKNNGSATTKSKTMVVQTVGSALNFKIPQLFPSKRTCILARPMIHGVEIPLSVPLLELIQEALYPDGFLHVSIVMMS